jgi:hypothetical protein
MNTRLLTLQTALQNHLLNESSDIYSEVIDVGKISLQQRLGIYKHAYCARLQEALATNYPIMQLYLGDDQFDELAKAYIAALPSNFRSIRWYGDCLEHYLTTTSPYNDYSYLAELAKVEWEMTLVFDAPDDAVFELTRLNAIPFEAWADMRLQVHASVGQHDFLWNVVDVWKKLSDEQQPPDLIQHTQKQSYVFWRKELANYYSLLEPDEAAAIGKLCAGASFGDICEALCDYCEEEAVPLRAVTLLKGWITAGLISDIQY